MSKQAWLEAYDRVKAKHPNMKDGPELWALADQEYIDTEAAKVDYYKDLKKYEGVA